MNYISNRHRLHSDSISEPRVLTHPEEYLGPNYKTVLNYWISEKNLVLDQREKFDSQYNQLHWNNIHINYMDLASQIAHPFVVRNCSKIIREIIAAHLVLDPGYSLRFIPILSYL